MSEARELMRVMENFEFEVQDTGGFGEQVIFFFQNGFGASVSRNMVTGGSARGLWEMALVRGTRESWDLVYDNGRFQDVSGWMTVEDVAKDLEVVAALAVNHEVFNTAKMFRDPEWMQDWN